jgi:hypothetical protein
MGSHHVHASSCETHNHCDRPTAPEQCSRVALRLGVLMSAGTKHVKRQEELRERSGGNAAVLPHERASTDDVTHADSCATSESSAEMSGAMTHGQLLGGLHLGMVAVLLVPTMVFVRTGAREGALLLTGVGAVSLLVAGLALAGTLVHSTAVLVTALGTCILATLVLTSSASPNSPSDSAYGVVRSRSTLIGTGTHPPAQPALSVAPLPALLRLAPAPFQR